MVRSPARTLALAAVSALLLTATACGERDFEVVGSKTVSEGTSANRSAEDAPAEAPDAEEPTESPAAIDPRLNQEPTTVGIDGTAQMHLPYAWEAFPGSDLGAAGEGAMITGGLMITVVPAEGRSQDEWVAALLAGTTELFADDQGMEAQASITTASGLTLFHLAQTYSENRAQLFGTVVDDTLHLVRFGLDGTAEASEIAAASAATLALL